MAYLRPLQTLDKPVSYTLGTSQTVYRGQVVTLLASDGLAYGTYSSGNAMVAGLSIDNNASSIYEKLIATYTTSITLDATGSGTASTISTGKVFKGSDMGATGFDSLTGWTVTHKGPSESTYTAVDDTSTWYAATDVSAGTIAVTSVNSTGDATGAGSIQVTAVLDILKSGDGFTSVEDQFDNSTSGSGKTTVYWSEGIYETDQYDPNVSYSVGAPLYVKGDGTLVAGTESAVLKDADGDLVVGQVLRAPSLTLTAETRVTSGESNPKPESLQFFFRKPVTQVTSLA